MRIARLVLCAVKFACSMVVLGMVGSSLAIVHATRNLAARGGSRPWAASTGLAPQVVVLTVACISAAAVLLSAAATLYRRRGCYQMLAHAKLLSAWWLRLAIVWCVVDLVLWCAAAAVFESKHAGGHGLDIWGWACARSKEHAAFSGTVNYALVCRLQVRDPDSDT